MNHTDDTRYPYTYACDYIRSIAGCDENGTKLSRSDASTICKEIANAINMDREELCSKLADHYKKNEDEIAQKSAEEFLRS